MTKYRTLDHPMIPMVMWNPGRPAEWINDHIAMVHATSNVYVITGEEGDVLINSATAEQSTGTREKLEKLLGRKLRVAKMIFTQSHPDHIGGWQTFIEPGTEIIVQRSFLQICAERKMLGDYFIARNARVLAALSPPGKDPHGWFSTPDPTPLTTFADSYDFTFSGRRYHLTSLSSGETLDALGVWLPDEKVLFTGNWAGAIYGAMPNFYTARGDRDRSIPGWLEDCRKLMALDAELLITGHEQPIEGKDRVRADFQKLHDLISFIHDHTIQGMNAQKSLSTIMSEIRIPDHLKPADGRGPVHWYVRSIWEEYSGWFLHERTSELYPSSHTSVWPELVELAGGAEVIADRAAGHLRAGDAEKALHLIEMAVAVAPDNRSVRTTELAVYEALADQSEGRMFDLLGWLEGKIMSASAALEGKGS